MEQQHDRIHIYGVSEAADQPQRAMRWMRFPQTSPDRLCAVLCYSMGPTCGFHTYPNHPSSIGKFSNLAEMIYFWKKISLEPVTWPTDAYTCLHLYTPAFFGLIMIDSLSAVVRDLRKGVWVLKPKIWLNLDAFKMWPWVELHSMTFRCPTTFPFRILAVDGIANLVVDMQRPEMRVILGIRFPILNLNSSKFAWIHKPAAYFASLVKPWEVMRNAKHERQTFLSYFKPKSGSILKAPNPLANKRNNGICNMCNFTSQAILTYPNPKIVWNQWLYFEWSPPWHYFVIVFDISPGSTVYRAHIFWYSILASFLASILTFSLTFCLAFILIFHLASILTIFLASILAFYLIVFPNRIENVRNKTQATATSNQHFCYAAGLCGWVSVRCQTHPSQNWFHLKPKIQWWCHTSNPPKENGFFECLDHKGRTWAKMA